MRPHATFPLRDETGMLYQLHVEGHCFGLMPRIHITEFRLESGHPIVSRKRVIKSSVVGLKASLDGAISTIHVWMAEHGATSLGESSL
jgi:hypothetical protein